MITKKDIHFSVAIYSSDEELPRGDADLLAAARAVTKLAYAPYSHFLVGAVAALANGKTVTGTNQENASYPVGICAERVLLSSVASQYPGVAVNTIAISYDNIDGQSDHPISPCGICRQSLAEYEERVKQPIRLIMSGMKGEVYILEKAGQLLPLSFSASDLG
ncbi:MAG: cytidine deaminase [Ferruginibacter sp.]|nr:cytidine deaminase [Ferruginibacter sp.]